MVACCTEGLLVGRPNRFGVDATGLTWPNERNVARHQAKPSAWLATSITPLQRWSMTEDPNLVARSSSTVSVHQYERSPSGCRMNRSSLRPAFLHDDDDCVSGSVPHRLAVLEYSKRS